MTDIASALFALAPHLAGTAKPGSNHVMIQCPFHGGGQEKTPSCSVALDKPVFFCHGCQTSGHVSQLLKQFGLGKDGVAVVLKAAGMDQKGPAVSRKGKTAAKLVSSGLNVYRGSYILDNDLLDAYRAAPKLLIRQGFDKATLRHFEVGFDNSHLRITFPLRNAYGDLVGISGRNLVEDTGPKYRIYDRELKSRRDFHVPDDYTMEGLKEALMWHAHIVRPFLVARNETLVITEGFKACMWTWQAGYKTVVALVGAYLSDLHAEWIASVAQRVVLFLDNNEAGWKGTYHAGRRLTRYGIDVQVATYPDDREQADNLSNDEVNEAIYNTGSYLHWRQQHAIHETARYGFSGQGK